jgi:glucosamine-6-phosphate deaminase
MEWNKADNYGGMSRLGADRLFEVISKKLTLGQPANIGIATGNTMIKLYAILAGMLNQSRMDLTTLSTYNLDEYVDDNGCNLGHEHPLSYRSYMRKHFFDLLDPALGFKQENMFFPDAQSPETYDFLIAETGGLDIQLLGVGFNGHVAFNEPIKKNEISVENFATLPSRIVKLDKLTLQTNAQLTAGNNFKMVPRKAVTMGMLSILTAKRIILLACFNEQAEPLSKIKSGKITPELPASFLLEHVDTEIIYTQDTILL